MRLTFRVIIAGILLLIINPSYAIGTLIPAPDRIDMVHDFKRNLIYVSNGSQVLRYDVATGALLTPFDIGGFPTGMDISPDGNTLAVADRARSDTQVWIHTIDLDTGAISQIVFTRASQEGGTFTVAYGADSALLVTSRYEGSGSVPLRRYDFSTQTTTLLASVLQNTMIISSGDLNNIAYAESNSSGGPFGNFNVVSQLLDSGPGTDWFNYEIGVNYNGTQFSVPTYGGTIVYDEYYTELATIGTYANPQPIGVVYHPAEDIVYYAWRDSREVRAYDTQTLTQTDAYDFEYTFVSNYNAAFGNGRLKTAADGSMLMGTVRSGVRYVSLYEPLSAYSLSVTTDKNMSVPVTLDASVGNDGEVSFLVIDSPSHGTLSGSPPELLYTPDQNYTGVDSFVYQASYGKASVPASVDITIVATSLPPGIGAVINGDNSTPPKVDLSQVTNATFSYGGDESVSPGSIKVVIEKRVGRSRWVWKNAIDETEGETYPMNGGYVDTTNNVVIWDGKQQGGYWRVGTSYDRFRIRLKVKNGRQWSWRGNWIEFDLKR